MSWHTSMDTFVWIFSVGRGNATFVRTGMNLGFIIDMGCADGGFDPAAFIKKHFAPRLTPYSDRRIAQALLSHPHKDHIAQCEALRDGLAPHLMTCPHHKDPKEAVNWKRIVNPAGSDDLIACYKSLYANRTLPLRTIVFDKKYATPPELEYGLYYVRPPVCENLHQTDDNKYGNATSIMFYLRYGANSILLPGDITPEGMTHVLRQSEGTEKRYTVFSRTFSAEHPNWHMQTTDQWSLEWLLKTRGLSILVAPHHGLESCYSPELYSVIKGGKPELVAISEKKCISDTDGCCHPNYQSDQGASGLTVEVDGRREVRKSITTKDGCHILIVFTGRGVPRVYANKDADYLLRVMEGRTVGAKAS